MVWPQPKAMIKELKHLNFKWGLWVWPYVGGMHQTERQAEIFREGVERGFFVKKADSSPQEVAAWHGAKRAAMVDLTNPAAYDWWKELLKRLIREYDLDFLKLDGGMDGLSPITFGRGEAVFHKGGSFKRFGNLWFYLYNRCAAEALEEITGNRPFLWTHQYRTPGEHETYAGKHLYPGMLLLGDTSQEWVSLKALIKYAQNLSRAGISYWTNDIGGYKNSAARLDPELYIRWAQFEFFCPYPEALGDTRVNPDIMRREPWSFNAEICAAWRKIAELRYRLIPYIYSCAYQYHRTGFPFVRAMDMEFPDEELPPCAEYQYMFGDAFLVAPIYEKGTPTKRPVYLPKGRWIDYWTGAVYRGGRTIEYTARLDIIPLFVRSGSIIPMGPPMEYMDQKSLDPLTLDIYPRKSKMSFTLYEDDGITDRYLEGIYRLTVIETSLIGDSLVIKIKAPKGKYRGLSSRTCILKINGQKRKPEAVYLNDHPLPERNSIYGWWYDESIEVLYVKIKQGREEIKVSVQNGTVYSD